MEKVVKTELGFNTNKSLVKDSVENFRWEVEKGIIDPLTAGVVIKKAEKFIKEVYSGENGKKLKELITNDTKERLDELLENHGVTGSYGVVYSGYDFSNCNHPTLDKLKEIQQQVKEEIKFIEDELKAKYAQFQKPDFVDGKAVIPKSSFRIIIESDFELIKTENGEEPAEINIPKKIQSYGIKYRGIK